MCGKKSWCHQQRIPQACQDSEFLSIALSVLITCVTERLSGVSVLILDGSKIMFSGNCFHEFSIQNVLRENVEN